MIESVQNYAESLQGISIDYRRFELSWEKPWRLKRYSSKDSLDNKRITLFFDSYDELIKYICKEQENENKNA